MGVPNPDGGRPRPLFFGCNNFGDMVLLVPQISEPVECSHTQPALTINME
jgi:hypothetical protein